MEEFVENSLGHILWEYRPVCKYCKKPLALSAFELTPEFCDRTDTLILDICCTNCANPGRVYFNFPELEFVSLAGSFDFNKPRQGEHKQITREDVDKAIEEFERIVSKAR